MFTIKKISLSDLFIFVWLCTLPEYSLYAGASGCSTLVCRRTLGLDLAWKQIGNLGLSNLIMKN